MFRELFGSTENIGAASGSEFIYKNINGMQVISFHIVPPSGGTVVFESTMDGENWVGTTMRAVDADLLTQETSVEEDFIGSISGALQMKFRVSASGSSVGTVIGLSQGAPAVIETIEFNAPPHKIGYPIKHKNGTYTDAATGVALWTPAAGKKFVVTDVIVIVGGNNSGRVTIFDETNENGNLVFNGDLDIANNRQFSIAIPFNTPFISDAAGNVLRVTMTTAMTVDIIVHGYEI